ncbi:relaxase/mobilization nuclease domain-containing protein [Paenibacillus alvei]|uniref:relaxase/mobilization nuclease domain-containing protein n=1 Tax=Paenibacillus alvei TaxID=44250 RepID=UPI0013DA9234|nr:relaxase/mobilization nuclease domain-containing protein [Paenibacillus alvei]NEZ42620.1 relaxase/mobilization nuclease domain-containing protein [Paenibacillus alvei]
MATTAIWDVTDRLKRVIDYVANPEKTILPQTVENGLQQALNYVQDGSKTERQLYVSGINCDPLTAYEQMQRTKRQFQKTDGIMAFHGYQAFAPGETTPEIAHAIGVKLAQELWGERFEVVVSTHLDKQHLHNHFVLNAVSFLDGKRYYDNKASYALLRKTSDRLCREHMLSVIVQPERGKAAHYGEWKAEREHRPTWRGLIREEVDQAIAASMTMTQFFAELRKKGYEVKTAVKHLAIRPPGKERFVRLRSLGDCYTEEALKQRILQNRMPKQAVSLSPVRRRRGIIHYGRTAGSRKLKGLQGLYVKYLFQLGILPASRRMPKRPTFRLREDMRRMTLLTAQAKMLCEKKISTKEQLGLYLVGVRVQMEELINRRQGIYYRLRRCRDDGQREGYKADIANLSKQLVALRREVRLGEGILERSEGMQAVLREERRDWRGEEQRDEYRSRGGQSGREHEPAKHRGDGQNFRRRR